MLNVETLEKYIGKMKWRQKRKCLACTAWGFCYVPLRNDECHLWIRPKLSQQPQMCPYQVAKGEVGKYLLISVTDSCSCKMYNKCRQLLRVSHSFLGLSFSSSLNQAYWILTRITVLDFGRKFLQKTLL